MAALKEENARLKKRLKALYAAEASATGTAVGAADGDPIDPNAGTTPTVVGSAYTNNFAGATTTTLFNIDSNLDIVVGNAYLLGDVDGLFFQRMFVGNPFDKRDQDMKPGFKAP